MLESRACPIVRRMPMPSPPLPLVQRVGFITSQCRGQSVLHLGCTNFPYTAQVLASGTLLHAQIQAVASRVVGFDADAEGLAELGRLGIGDLYQADLERLDEVALDETFDVIVAGEKNVSGRQAIDALGGYGYRTIYMATGPQVHHLLLADNMIDRLYVTVVDRLLGGRPFSSLVEGDLLIPPVDMRLNALCFDPHALEGVGQQFICYER